MYNSVKLSKEDQHTHRFIWRWLDVEIEIIHFILLTVTFGDRPGGIIASLALQRTAEMNSKDYPCGAEAIKRNMYVDDLLKSVETIAQAKQLIQEVEVILKNGRCFIKHWLRSGKANQSISVLHDINFLDSKTERVLGMSRISRRHIQIQGEYSND